MNYTKLFELEKFDVNSLKSKNKIPEKFQKVFKDFDY
jgi:hypothetical protein